MMIKLIIVLLFLSTASSAQTIDSLSMLVKEIQRGENDSVRIASNGKFITGLQNLLMQPRSFNANYDSLKNVSILASDDKKFRIFSWVLPYFDGNKYEYFGFIQIHSEKSDTLIRLSDSTSVILKPESEKLSAKKWLGAIYYHVTTVKSAGKIYYTLLGWKGHDDKMTQKVIEILYFDGDKPKFGFPLFKTGSVFKNRILLSYNAQVTLTLHYDNNYNGIVFDHTGSNKNNSSIISGPDGTYDAFKLKKGKWILNSDVKVGSKLNPSESRPKPPQK